MTEDTKAEKSGQNSKILLHVLDVLFIELWIFTVVTLENNK